MREIILFESAHVVAKEVAPPPPWLDDLREQVADAMQGLSSEETIPDEFIIETYHEIRGLMSEKIGGFRLVGLKKPEDIRLNGIGQHWTLDWDSLSHHENFYVPNGSNLYVVHGYFDGSDIDVPQTIAYRYLFPEEREVFLEGGATIMVMGIYHYEGESDDPITDADGRFLFYGKGATA